MNRLTLLANLETDIQVALSLLKLKKGLRDVSETRLVGNVFACEILTTLDKQQVQSLLSSRFGRAIQVR